MEEYVGRQQPETEWEATFRARLHEEGVEDYDTQTALIRAFGDKLIQAAAEKGLIRDTTVIEEDTAD